MLNDQDREGHIAENPIETTEVRVDDAIQDDPLYERLRKILAGAVDTLKLGGASIYLLNETRDRLLGRVSVDEFGKGTDITNESFSFVNQGSIGQLLQGRTASASNSDTQEDGYSPDAAVALKVEDRIIGLLSAQNKGEGSRAEDNLESLKVFASQAAFAIEAADAAARWQQEARHERTLLEVSKAISSALNSNQILQLVAELMAKGIEAEKSAVYILEGDLKQLRHRVSYGVSYAERDPYPAIPLRLDEPAFHSLTEGNTVDVHPDSEDPLAARLAQAIDSTRGIAIPLISKGRLIALAVISYPAQMQELAQTDIDLLTAIAAQAAISIENATLYDAQNRAVTELAALYAVSQALAATPELTERLQVVAQSIMAVTGVSRCGMFLIENGEACGHVIIGGSEEQKKDFHKIRLGLSERETAMMQAIKEGKPTVIESPAGMKDGYMAVKWGIRRMLAVPLIYEGRTVGLAAADEPDNMATFSPNVIKVAAAIGEQAALAIQNARLFEQTRQHAEELEVLWEAGQALSAELRVEEIIDTLLALICRLPFCSAASIMVDHWDGWLLLAYDVGHYLRVRSKDYLESPLDKTCAQWLDTMEPHMVRDIPIEKNETHPRLKGSEIETVSVLSVPLIQKGQPSGQINVFSAENMDLGTREIRLVGSLASLAAAAITRAQFYERERRIAETFQRSFLPDVNEKFEGYDIAHQYAAALEESRVGGDFYDVFTLPDGRLALLIGDVSGKGLDAAVHTAMAKYLLRAYIYENPDPADVLTRVNDAICYFVPASMFVTLFYAILDTSNGLIYYASAGHELPLLWSNERQKFRSLACTGRALGFLPDAEYICEEMTIEPGDKLILYTDGVTEARNTKGFFDIHGIREAARPVVGQNSATIAEAIEQAARAHAGGRLSDDIALLVVGRVS